MKRAALLSVLVATAAAAQVRSTNCLYPSGPCKVGSLSINGQVMGSTAGALTLYVDAAGSDGNGCTSSGASACLTIQGALGKVPQNVRHPVIINVGVGTFAGAILSGYLVRTAATAALGSYLLIQGTYSTATVATGTATGTATAGTAGSGPTFGTLTDAAQTWTVNDLRGKMVEVTGGTGAGNRYIIDSNTATALTIVGFWVAPTGTSTYVIEDWGTAVNAALPQPAQLSSTAPTSNVVASSATTGAAFIADANVGGMLQKPSISIRGIKFTNTTGGAVMFRGPWFGDVHWCNFANGASTAFLVETSGATQLGVALSVFNRTGAGTDIQIDDTPLGQDSFFENLFTNSVGRSISPNGQWVVSSSDFSGGAPAVVTGASWSLGRIQNSKLTSTGGAACVTFPALGTTGTGQTRSEVRIISSSFSCGVGVQLLSPGTIWMDTATGTGNTTLVDARTGGQVYLSANTTADGNCSLDSGASPPTCATVIASYLDQAGHIRWRNVDSGTFIGELSP